LISLRPTGKPGWITTLGSTAKPYIVINQAVYTRE